MNNPFHLAFPVDNLEKAREFYGGILGCVEGRSSDSWIDFDFYGHQIVAHLSENVGTIDNNLVDGDRVPIPHFGVILSLEAFEELANRLKIAEMEFIIEPHTRFKGEIGEQATMFFQDPCGNALEFKAFADINQIFANQ